MMMDMDGFMHMIAQQAMKEMAGEQYENKDEAVAALQQFIEAKPDFKVGDRVVRNEAGKSNYKFPQGNQVAICTAIYDRRDNNGNNMEIGVVIGRDNFSFYRVDSRFYKKEAAGANVFQFQKKL